MLEIKKRTEEGDRDVINGTIQGLDINRLELHLKIEILKSDIENSDRNRRWVNWISVYEKNITQFKDQNFPIGAKKEILKGFLEKIILTQKDKQTISFTNDYNIPIIDDQMKYKNIKNKSKGYDLIEGNKTSIVELDLSRKKSIKINELGT